MAKGKILFRIELNNLEPGTCTITSYQISTNSGSSFDQWLKMGAPQELNEFQYQYLSSKSIPNYHIERKNQDGTIMMERLIPEHHCELIKIQCPVPKTLL